MVTVRPAEPKDADVLLRALAIAADWRPGARPRSGAAVLAASELARYVPDLTRARDRALVAEVDGGAPVGAAWWRFLPPDRPGYGFVAADVPEVSVGVLHGHRGQGAGTALLHGLITAASGHGLPGLSLSVEPDNPATGLYRRLGFECVSTHGGADTMLLPLR